MRSKQPFGPRIFRIRPLRFLVNYLVLKGVFVCMVAFMPQSQRFTRIKLVPISPDNASSVRHRAIPAVEQALRETGQEILLREGKIELSFDQNFPLQHLGELLLVKVVGDLAVRAVSTVVIPKLKEMFGVEEVKEEDSAGDAGPEENTAPETDLPPTLESSANLPAAETPDKDKKDTA